MKPRCLAEKVAESADAIDLAMVLGTALGSPPRRSTALRPGTRLRGNGGVAARIGSEVWPTLRALCGIATISRRETVTDERG